MQDDARLLLIESLMRARTVVETDEVGDEVPAVRLVDDQGAVEQLAAQRA